MKRYKNSVMSYFFTKTPKCTDLTNEGVPGSSTDHEGLLTADAAQTACDSVTTISDHPNVNKYVRIVELRDRCGSSKDMFTLLSSETCDNKNLRRSRSGTLANSTSYGAHELIKLQNSGLKLHCVVSGPTDKPLMLFVHGFPEFWYSWRHQLKEFSKDYRVVAFDMRGYGDSDKPSGVYAYTQDVLVDDIDQLIKALGYNSCVLVGHDWGGILVMLYAALHPERVDKLIVANITHPRAYYSHVQSGAVSQLSKSWYVFFFQVPILPEIFLLADDSCYLENVYRGKPYGAKTGTFTDEDIEAYKYTFRRYGDISGPVNFYRASVRYTTKEVERAYDGKITVPTLMIFGSGDGALEKPIAELTGNSFENCTVRYIDGASHWVQQEEPRQFNTFLRQFLA